MKITVVGAGAVGASCAEYIAIKDFASEVVLLDIKEGYAEGKAMDLMQTASLNSFDTKITGTTNDYSKTANSDICVITSGIPRKPGMTREELIGINAGIVKTVSSNLIKHSENAIIIVVSNPMDTMTYLVHKTTGIPKNRIIGMGGALDSARFKFFLSNELSVSTDSIQTMVLGGHGDTMVPLLRFTSISGIPLSEFIKKKKISKDKVEEIISRTRNGGGEIVALMKNSSAFFSPATSAIEMLESYLFDNRRILPCSAYLEGEYNVEGMCVGVPVIISKDGVEEIIELDLQSSEKDEFDNSVKAVRELVEKCGKLLAQNKN